MSAPAPDADPERASRSDSAPADGQKTRPKLEHGISFLHREVRSATLDSRREQAESTEPMSLAGAYDAMGSFFTPLWRVMDGMATTATCTCCDAKEDIGEARLLPRKSRSAYTPTKELVFATKMPNLQKSYDQQRHRPRFERKATCVSDTGLANRILSSNPHRPVLTKYRHTYRPAASRSRRTFTRTRGGTPAQCSIREGVDQDILQN